MSDTERVTAHCKCSILDTYTKWIIPEEKRTFSCTKCDFESLKHNCTSKLFTGFQPPPTDWINANGFLPAPWRATESCAIPGSIRWEGLSQLRAEALAKRSCLLVKLGYILMFILPSELWNLLHMIFNKKYHNTKQKNARVP